VRDFPASLIAKDAITETESTYEARVQDYQKRNYTYIPLPEDGQYFNVKEGWIRSLDEEQWITPETHLLDVMQLLQQQRSCSTKSRTASTGSSTSPTLISGGDDLSPQLQSWNP